MTTSRPTAATQTRANKLSHASILCHMLFLSKPSQFPGWWCTEYKILYNKMKCNFQLPTILDCIFCFCSLHFLFSLLLDGLHLHLHIVVSKHGFKCWSKRRQQFQVTATNLTHNTADLYFFLQQSTYNMTISSAALLITHTCRPKVNVDEIDTYTCN